MLNRLSATSLLILALLALMGCGGSSSSVPAESQLRAAKLEGEEAGREKDRIDRLERQVRRLRKQSGHRGAQVVVVGGGSASPTPDAGNDAATAPRTFHAPSGNVSCQLTSVEALCSVASAAITFAFEDGGPAHVESGALLPTGAGGLAAYGSTVTAGPVSCVIPNSSNPHGIICADAASGHGFEASRVPARQRTY